MLFVVLIWSFCGIAVANSNDIEVEYKSRVLAAVTKMSLAEDPGDLFHPEEHQLFLTSETEQSGERLFETLVDLLDEVNNPSVVAGMLSLMSETGVRKSELIAVVEEILENGHPAEDDEYYIAYSAIGRIEKFGSERHVDLLLEYVDHEHRRVRIQATKALGAVAGLDAIEKIRAKLDERRRRIGEEEAKKDLVFLNAEKAINKISSRFEGEEPENGVIEEEKTAVAEPAKVVIPKQEVATTVRINDSEASQDKDELRIMRWVLVGVLLCSVILIVAVSRRSGKTSSAKSR